MKCKMYLLALSAMALATGCSNDETTELNKGNAIDFSVTAGKLTRAEATTTNTIKEFKVWAFTDGKTYMDGTPVTKSDNKWTYSGTKFWPETNVDFFAISPMAPKKGTLNITNEQKELTDYEVENGSEDLLYAANFGETKRDAKNNTPVGINFRHALSQIVFKAKLTDNSTIDVDIAGITIDGVANKATLTWASATTGSNLTTTDNDTETGSTWGTWSKPEGTKSYFMNAVVDGNTQNVFLTLNSQMGVNESPIGEPLFLMPQTLNPWLTMKDNNAKVTGTARLLIKCKITDRESGAVLWPKQTTEGSGYADVAISLDNPKNDPNRDKNVTNDPKHDKWMQGKKYTYTLIFGEGGGYTPDPEGPDPDPVLVPIKFEVTVDEFQDGGEYDLNANNPANP